MRYVGLIINDLGEQSKNPREDVTETSGVSDNEILRYLSSATSYIQSQVLRQVGHTNYFDSRTTVALVASQKEYTLPADLYYDQKVRRVRYSSSGLAADYQDILPLGTTRFSEDYSISSPSGYAVSNRTLVIEGVPTSGIGNMQVVYVRRLDRPDKRRGKIQSVTNNGTNYTTIVLEDDIWLDADRITVYLEDYLCVNSATGTVNYYNAYFTAYDSGSRTITLSNAAMSSGTISVGDYITLGKYTTTHIKLPVECEHYLIEFADWKLKKGDSSEDAGEANAEMVMLMDDIIAQFANMYDIQAIPVYDPAGDFT